MRWLDGLGGASLDGIRRRFGLGRTQAYRRVQVLQDYGLLRRLRPLVNMPALYVVAGRRILKPWTFAHALLLGELVADLEVDGRTVLGEVTIRRERLDGWSGEVLTEAQVDTIKRCERIPDLVELRPDAELVAYEVEIASKGRARRERILLAYALSDYVAVEWIAPDRQLARLLRKDIREMHVAGQMRVTHGSRIELPTLADQARLTAEEVRR